MQRKGLSPAALHLFVAFLFFVVSPKIDFMVVFEHKIN